MLGERRGREELAMDAADGKMVFGVMVGLDEDNDEVSDFSELTRSVSK
jgi:hypothetical protein